MEKNAEIDALHLEMAFLKADLKAAKKTIKSNMKKYLQDNVESFVYWPENEQDAVINDLINIFYKR